MYCRNCGAQLRDGVKFCPNCGMRIRLTVPHQTERDSAIVAVHDDVPSYGRPIGNEQTCEPATASPIFTQKAYRKHFGRRLKYGSIKPIVFGIAVFAIVIAVIWYMGVGSFGITSAGNTAGNINSNGLAAEQDGWTYYLNEGSSSGCSIRKISSEGKSESVVWSSSSATALGYLNISDGEAYFIKSSSSGDSICKVGLDGKNESTVWSASGNTTLGYLSVIGDEAYFTSHNSDDSYQSICKIGLDGSNEKKIFSGSASSVGDLNIVGSEVYFVNSGSICKVGIDGTNEKVIYKGSVDDLNVINNEAYFVSGNSICKVGLDGKNESTVWSTSGNTTLHWLNIVDDAAYFESYNFLTSSYAICKVETDSTNETTLWSTKGGSWPIYLNIVDGEIYFFKFNNDLLYRIDISGKNERTV